MQLSFSESDEAFRAEVRAFLDENLSDHMREGAAACSTVFVEPDIGREWEAILNEKGWLSYQWPTEYGGPGWTPIQRYIFEKECAEAGAPSLPILSLKLFGPVVYTFGTQEQKERLLPRVLNGEDYYCQGFSEPNAGSDLANLKTTAVRTGDDYSVNGSKIWTTHAHHANKIFCLVRTSKEGKPQAGISFLLIDMRQPGVSVRPISSLAGDHEVNQVFFDNAVAPVEDRIGEEGQGWAIAKFLLENERGGSCHAPKLLADLLAIEKAAEHEPDGEGGVLRHNKDWQKQIAKVRLSAKALDILELRILSQIAKGERPGPQTSLTKYLASLIRQDIDLAWMDLYGDAGLQLTPDRPLYGDNAPEPHHSHEAQIAAPRYLNSRAWTVFGGTNEIQSDIIAKTVLNL